MITTASVTRVRHRLAISWRLNCPMCGANCIEANCDHHPSFVADVPIQEVTEAAFELFTGGVSRLALTGQSKL